MDEDVQPAPTRSHLIEYRLELPRRGYVHCSGDRSLQVSSKRLNKAARLFIQPGNRQISAERTKGLGAAIGDRVFVSDPKDKRLFPLEHRAQLQVVHGSSAFQLSDGVAALRRAAATITATAHEARRLRS